jgi:hypothetical protein
MLRSLKDPSCVQAHANQLAAITVAGWSSPQCHWVTMAVTPERVHFVMSETCNVSISISQANCV